MIIEVSKPKGNMSTFFDIESVVSVTFIYDKNECPIAFEIELISSKKVEAPFVDLVEGAKVHKALTGKNCKIKGQMRILPVVDEN